MSRFDTKIKTEINFPTIKFDDTDTKAQRKKAGAAFVASNLKGMTAVEEDIGAALDLAIESPTWAWNRDPIWRDGTRPGNPRDIIYKGKLKDSRKLKTKFLQTKATLTIAYTAPYANFIYHGGAMQPYGNKNAATVLIPGRPWIEAILNGTHGMEKFDAAGIFFKAWSVEFEKRMA